MSEPIFYEIIKAPATSIVVFVCACFWILTSTNRLSFEDIGITYEKIVRDWQFWRVFTASLAHANLLHLAFNMTSLWSCRFVEFTELGFLFYMKTSFLLLVGSVLVMLVIYHILITQFGKDHYRNSLAVGYSCVVFGWITIVAQRSPTSTVNYMGVVDVPGHLAPFASLIVTSLIIPNSSFIGHLSGIIIGYMVSWGWFSWFSNYFFACCLVWCAIVVAYSLYKAGKKIPCIDMEQASPAKARMVNGVLVREANNASANTV